MAKQYGFLKFSKVTFQVLGWIAFALSIISGIVIIVTGGTPEAPRLFGAIAILSGFLYLFIFLVASSIIGLLLDIKNTITKKEESVS